MTAYADLAQEFAGWLKTREAYLYPASTRGKPAAFLDQLDKRLFAEDRKNSHHVAMARWILSLPDVEVMPDSIYQARLDALAARNPELAQRQDDQAVAGLAWDLAHPIRVGAARACLTAKPPRELLRLIRGGTSSWFGTSMPSWEVETDLGRGTVLVIDGAYVLIPSDIPNVKEPKDLDDVLALAGGRATTGMVKEARARAKPGCRPGRYVPAATRDDRRARGPDRSGWSRARCARVARRPGRELRSGDAERGALRPPVRPAWRPAELGVGRLHPGGGHLS